MRNSVLAFPAGMSNADAKRRGRDTLANFLLYVKPVAELVFGIGAAAFFISVLCYLMLIAY